ncbi:MAG: IgGFc-binding protein [Polyangiaceae bacterium]
MRTRHFSKRSVLLLSRNRRRVGGRWLWVPLVASAFSACGTSADPSPSSSGGTSGAGTSGVGGLDGGGGITVGGSGGTIDFDAGKCPRCSDDLHQILNCDGTVQTACLGAEGCDVSSVKCINACDAANKVKRSVGCEYYSVFMDQLDPNACFAVFIANTWNQAAQIQIEYDGQKLPVDKFGYLPIGKGPSLAYVPLGTDGISPGKVAILFLAGPDGVPAKDNPVCPKPSAVPNGAMLFNATGKGKAFRITTDVPVVAYQMNPFGGGSAAVTGASLLIPTSAWDTNYLAIHAYDAGPQLTSMNIVAKEPTTVNILPKKPIAGGGGLNGGPAGLPYSVTLGAGEHVQFTQLDSLGGSTIQSDKPVGLFGGARCSQIPYNVYACDHLEQMIPPIRALGHEYVGVSHKPRGGEPAYWRIMGIVDGTVLSWSADIGGPTTIDQGQIIEFVTQFPFVVTSQDKDHPFLLMAHMTGGDTKNMNGVGDADAVLSVPPSQFLNSYVFFTDPTYPVTDLVVVRAKTDEGKFEDVQLDCAFYPVKDWKPVGDYEWARVDLTQGDFENVGPCSSGARKMESKGPFGLWVWGWGSPQTSSFTSYVSYGYPAGMNIELINKVVVDVPK